MAMTRKNEPMPAESTTALKEAIERDKRGALADFDSAAFETRLLRKLAADPPPRPAPSDRLPRGVLWRVALGAAAILVVAVVIRMVLPRAPSTDPRMIARVLAGADFFVSTPLDRPPSAVAGKRPPSSERDLEWSIQALFYRARRGGDGGAPDNGSFASVILAALAGSPPTAAVSWPSVDPDELEQRILVLGNSGAFVRAFNAMR
jgi:hypothetical protein